jgi:mono/diheme cytochrome c family protein
MRWLGALAAGAALVVLASGCGDNLKNEHADTVHGKQLFVQKCGACHVLARANTKGIQGPNLDEAFQQSIKDGIKRDTVEGVVYRQILYPNQNTDTKALVMPPKLVTGDDANDVAAYVASVAAKPGKDTGLLATVGQAQASTKPVAAKDGVLEIDADPSGQLAYVAKAGTAPAGALKLKSQNKSGTPHDIAIEGNGVNDKGEVVQNGGVSEVDVTLKSGVYTFYCSVPGHRQAGMEGKITVK